jgi:hypothetical protein
MLGNGAPGVSARPPDGRTRRPSIHCFNPHNTLAVQMPQPEFLDAKSWKPSAVLLN